MKRKLLSILLALSMVLTLLPTAAFAADDGGDGGAAAASGKVAKIGDTEYATLADAIASVTEYSETPTEIVLIRDAVGGVKIGAEQQKLKQNIILDLNGHTYNVKTGVGSTGTETNGIQLLLGSKCVIKNGTMTTDSNVSKFLIKNYCDLTLENVFVDGSNVIAGNATINNCGMLTVKGDADKMKVTAPTNGYAITTGNYVKDTTPTTTIENGTIDSVYTEGSFWVATTGETVDDSSAHTKILGGKIGSVGIYYWDNEKSLKWTFSISDNAEVEQINDFTAKIHDNYYATLAAAIAAAQNNDTVTLLKDTTESNIILKSGTLDLGGYTLDAGNRSGYGLRAANGIDVTIKNGTVKNAYSALSIWGSNDSNAPTKVTVAEDVTFTESASGIIFTGYSDKNDFTGKTGYAVLNFNGTITTGAKQCPIFVMGNLGNTAESAAAIGENGNQINIGATARITSEEEGIVLNGMAKLSVEDGAVITGADAITMKRGYLNITGGTFTGTGDKHAPTAAEHSGAERSGSAITVSSTYNYSGLIDVKISGGTFESANSYGFYAGQSVENGSSIAFTNTSFAISGGNFSGGEAAVYFADGKYITGGLFSSDPSDYVADGHYVDASDNGDYPYIVKEGTKTDAPIIVKDNTTVATPNVDGLTDTDKANISENTRVDGVAEAVAAKKADLIPEGVDIENATKVEVEVSVKVEVTGADLTSENKTLTFEAKPVATIKVDGDEKATDVPVPNSLLSGEITVKLPLPTDFIPEQIKHISSDGSVEYFLKTAKRGANTFKIKDGCAVFTITKFSTFELSGTVTYVEPSYSSGSSYDPTYSVTVDKTENGTVTVSPKSASKGDTVTVTVKPDSGYVLETLTVTDKNGNELTLKDKGNGKYTFTMPAGKVEVKASFAKEIETSPFADVAIDDYYYEAVKWAVKNGITTGVGNDLFAPGQPCTRAQIVTFLWRASGSPEPKGTAAGMTDVVSGSYYEKAVAWAIENGVTTGTTATTFSPDATCTRAQAVTFLARALNAKASGKAEFSDVPTDSYFAEAVAWAAANGVTEGIGGGLFGSDNDCTRGQIVTFLWRAYTK